MSTCRANILTHNQMNSRRWLLGLPATSLAVAAAVLALAACNYDEPTRVSSTSGSHASQVRMPNQHVAGSLRSEEEAAIQELLSLIPEGHREMFARGMRPGSGMRIMKAPDGRAAELVERIYEIRALDARARRLEMSRQAAREQRSTVLLVLVDELPARFGPGGALVIRRSEPTPANMIVLHKAYASPAVLSASLQALFRSREAYGDILMDDAVVPIAADTESSLPAPRFARMRQHLRKLASAPVSDVAGIGEGKTLTVTIGPVRTTPAGR